MNAGYWFYSKCQCKYIYINDHWNIYNLEVVNKNITLLQSKINNSRFVVIFEIKTRMLSKKRLFKVLQDNAPVHKSRVSMAALHTHGFKSLLHPPCSPDLALLSEVAQLCLEEMSSIYRKSSFCSVNGA